MTQYDTAAWQIRCFLGQYDNNLTTEDSNKVQIELSAFEDLLEKICH
jgi:hypothetical protein